jgi:hypothetical protein
MRNTDKYSAVTKDEGNAADGHYQTASRSPFVKAGGDFDWIQKSSPLKGGNRGVSNWVYMSSTFQSELIFIFFNDHYKRKI